MSVRKKAQDVDINVFDQLVDELVPSELCVVEVDVVEVMEELESVSSAEED